MNQKAKIRSVRESALMTLIVTLIFKVEDITHDYSTYLKDLTDAGFVVRMVTFITR
jgi:hypothetical protein